jgi:hypothetical protein
MAVHDIGLDTLAEALLQKGFSKTDEFGLFMTYERANDYLKIHVDFDGSLPRSTAMTNSSRKVRGCRIYMLSSFQRR